MWRYRKPIKWRAPNYGVVGVVGEYPVVETHYPRSAVRSFAKRLRMSPTAGERRLEKIFKELNGGVLQGRFVTQHVVSGDWIVDFYFQEVRLAVEVDGSFHASERQKARDRKKDRYCDSIDITVVRVRNSDVFGEREQLLAKLRSGWRRALARRNKIIGSSYISSKPSESR